MPQGTGRGWRVDRDPDTQAIRKLPQTSHRPGVQTPDGRFFFFPKDITMASIFRRGKKWSIEYTDEHGIRRRKAGFTDKSLTIQLAAQIERDVARIKVGLPTEHLGKSKREKIDSLIAEWAESLASLGRQTSYINTARNFVARVARDCGWVYVNDIKNKDLSEWLSRKSKESQCSGRTINAYRDLSVRFVHWLCRTERLGSNTLSKVLRAKEMKVKPRRAMTLNELNALCAAVPEERAFVYKLAAYSGLRRIELCRLEVQDCQMTGPKTSWRWKLRPEVTKNGRAENLPMLPEAADLLEARLKAGKLRKGSRVAPTVPKATTLKRDMASAGVERHDANGRVADWHSLRYTFCTELARVLPIQQVRILMRHQHIQQTIGTYLDLGLDDLAEIIQQLPRVFEQRAPR